jgi:hypothetical protein
MMQGLAQNLWRIVKHKKCSLAMFPESCVSLINIVKYVQLQIYSLGKRYKITFLLLNNAHFVQNQEIIIDTSYKLPYYMLPRKKH